MISHSEDSHRQSDSRWYCFVKYGKWYGFNLKGKSLDFIERLAIFGMEQPIYNDCDTYEASIKCFFGKLRHIV